MRADRECATAAPGVLEKISYGFGNVASCLYWQTFMAYLTFYYTDVFGLGAAAAGTMIGLSRSLDAFLDPVVGLLADRTSTRWGKFRPFLVWFSGPLAVMGVLTFTVPSLGSSGKLAWAYATYNALMLLYTAANIPYAALLGVIASDPDARTRLCSIQFVGAFVGGSIVSATLLPMARVGGWLGAASAAQGWQLAFAIYGAAAVVFFLVTFLGVRERVRPPPAQRISVGRDLGDLVTNGPWLILLAATVIFVLSGAIRTSVTAYYFKYFVRSEALALPSFLGRGGDSGRVWSWESLVSLFNTGIQIASLLGVVLVPLAARALGRRPTIFGLFLVVIVATAAFAFLGPGQVPAIFAFGFAGALASGALTALLWAMYADTADYGEWKRGRRATGLVFSAAIFSQKQGWAIGSWVALAVMQSVGFVPNVDQPAKSLRAIVLLMSVVSAGLAAAAAGLVAFYPLNNARMSEITAELARRRGIGSPDSNLIVS